MYTNIGNQKCNVLIRGTGDVARHKLGVFSWIKNDLKELGKKNGCNYKCYTNITLGVIRVYNTNIRYDSEVFEYDIKRFFNNHTKYPVDKNDIVPGEDKGYINVEYILEFSNNSNNVIIEIGKDDNIDLVNVEVKFNAAIDKNFVEMFKSTIEHKTDILINLDTFPEIKDISNGTTKVLDNKDLSYIPEEE